MMDGQAVPWVLYILEMALLGSEGEGGTLKCKSLPWVRKPVPGPGVYRQPMNQHWPGREGD